ncbi:MAG: SDR family oxidoreductase [Acidimicrobiales bacterium]
MSSTNRAIETVLVTGASGYIGGRLVGRLLDAGYHVRCLARTPEKLANAPWRSEVDVVQGDIEGDLTEAVEGVDAIYYLIHSIGESSDWEASEARSAANLRDAAARAGVRRIIYLGALGASSANDLSPHLTSRHRVGEVLADGSVPVTELRAAVIIGSGSASFEMLRYLVEVLPVMVTPKWVDTRCQPIAVRDVIRYLVDVLQEEATVGRVLDIGGPDVLTYRQMMSVYAREAGLRSRLVIPVPVLTPRLSSHWVGLVTPLPRSLARPLVDSLVNEVIVEDDEILGLCPGPRLDYASAVNRALANTRSHDISTRWTGAEQDAVAAPLPTDPDWSGGAVLQDVREGTIDAPPSVVFRTVSRIGGEEGWYSGQLLWSIRGAVDKLIGGPGMRRGRRDPAELRVGDPVDFWRVEAIETDSLIRLRAEMRLPGVASLEWRMAAVPGGTHLTQTATFVPRGLWGRLYWYGVAPFHGLVFPGLGDGIAAACVRSVLDQGYEADRD